MAGGGTSSAAWTWVAPVLAWVALIIALVTHLGGIFLVVVAVLLGAAVFAAVHHAEVVAHRVGEPFGTLVLAVAVTVIEVALIVSVMLSGGEAKAALARDTVFSAIMICCNGILGLCLLLGGIRHREQAFQLEGASVALAVLGALAILSLVLPNFTTSAPGPFWSPPQLAFAGVAALVLYGSFVFAQTVRHRDYFLPVETDGGEESHAAPPSNRQALISLGLLLVCLVAVVGLAKVLSPSIEAAVANAGAPDSVVGIIIAALVLLPEGMAATKAAAANRLQTSLNLALGSALASIGLTIPVLAGIFIVSGRPLVLGLRPLETVLLVLTLFTGTITLGTGKSNLIKGVVHLVIFAAFLFLSVVP
jgi:Ca2+:H+ antiporter